MVCTRYNRKEDNTSISPYNSIDPVDLEMEIDLLFKQESHDISKKLNDMLNRGFNNYDLSKFQNMQYQENERYRERVIKELQPKLDTLFKNMHYSELFNYSMSILL